MIPLFESRKNGESQANIILLALMLLLTGLGRSADAQTQQGPESTAPSLGVSQMMEQVVLPGTPLTHKKVNPKTTPLIVRVVRSFPHGDAFRYDISYFGMTPGNFDLRDFLVREDGSDTDDLPPLPVNVSTILDEGQVEPNELEVGSLSRYGGYWQLLLLGSIAWVAILLAMIFVGRKRKEVVEVKVKKKVTLAELLQPSIEKAMAGKLPKEKHAELERLLFGFWQKKLQLGDSDPASVLRQIRSHDQSGPLMKQIELWLHSPGDAGAHIDLNELLAPYRKFDANEIDYPDESDEPTGAAGQSAESQKIAIQRDSAPQDSAPQDSGAGQ